MIFNLGKYESNCTVLRLALEYADHISEAFEVLAALVESEMSLLLANCQVAGIGLSGGRSVLGQTDTANKDCTTLWKRATERRRTAENLARCLLTRHERDTSQDTRRNTRYCLFSSIFHPFLFFLLKLAKSPGGAQRA